MMQVSPHGSPKTVFQHTKGCCEIRKGVYAVGHETKEKASKQVVVEIVNFQLRLLLLISAPLILLL